MRPKHFLNGNTPELTPEDRAIVFGIFVGIIVILLVIGILIHGNN